MAHLRANGQIVPSIATFFTLIADLLHLFPHAQARPLRSSSSFPSPLITATLEALSWTCPSEVILGQPTLKAFPWKWWLLKWRNSIVAILISCFVCLLAVLPIYSYFLSSPITYLSYHPLLTSCTIFFAPSYLTERPAIFLECSVKRCCTIVPLLNYRPIAIATSDMRRQLIGWLNEEVILIDAICGQWIRACWKSWFLWALKYCFV